MASSNSHLPGQFNLFRAGIHADDAGVTAAFEPMQETAVPAGDFRDRERGVFWQPRADEAVVNISLFSGHAPHIVEGTDAPGLGLEFVIIEMIHSVDAADPEG
jgi:hypothetical protein